MKEPFTEAPGEVFRYNTIATYMLSASLKARGIDLEDYLQEKLLTPMGVTGTHWQRDCRGTCTGGFGFCLFPEVIAKLGVLILQDGVWEGRQLVPKEYLALATRTQISKPGRRAASPQRLERGLRLSDVDVPERRIPRGRDVRAVLHHGSADGTRCWPPPP